MALTNRLPARFTLAHGLMILAGLMTFVLVNSALADNRRTETIFVATDDAAAGRTFIPVPTEIDADTPGLEYFASAAQLDGKVLVRSIPAGQPIMVDDLVPTGSLEFRLFAIPAEAYQIDGLGLDRNDRVDVIGFDEDKNPVYLATDLVVAGRSRATNEGLGTVSDSYITVEVDENAALRLSKGQLNGPLNLVRSTGANAIAPVTAPTVESGEDDEAAASQVGDTESADGEDR